VHLAEGVELILLPREDGRLLRREEPAGLEGDDDHLVRAGLLKSILWIIFGNNFRQQFSATIFGNNFRQQNFRQQFSATIFGNNFRQEFLWLEFSAQFQFYYLCTYAGTMYFCWSQFHPKMPKLFIRSPPEIDFMNQFQP
jgi:hypothetical protein